MTDDVMVLEQRIAKRVGISRQDALADYTALADHVVLVDEKDQAVGVESKMRAHELGLLHRAFSVLIFRHHQGKLEFLLQQRHADKYHCGNLWTNTCCSHPRLHETVIAAGERRLKEEMSLEIPLTFAGSFTYRASFANGLTEHEFDHVLLGEYQEGMPIVADPKEVQNFAWMQVDVLLSELKAEPAIKNGRIAVFDAPQGMPAGRAPGWCESPSQLEIRRVYTPWFKPALDIALEQLCHKY